MIYYLSLIPVNSYRRMGTVADQILEAKIEFLKGCWSIEVFAGETRVWSFESSQHRC